jgi:hypothetical protein
LGEEIVDPILKAYVRQREWIERRLRENRERYAEEAIFERMEDEETGEADEEEPEEGNHV